MNELELRLSGLARLTQVVRLIGATFGQTEPHPVQAHAERMDRQQLLLEVNPRGE